MVIEVELRSFLDKEKYDELLEFFKQNAELLKDDYQMSYYFDCDEDLRIQKNKFFSKVWLKKGAMHDEAREEVEIKFPVEDFDKLEQLFLGLGNKVEIKWFRDRKQFDWGGINVSLDYTRGYGYILELERQVDNKVDKEIALVELRKKFVELGVEITPKEKFEDRFKYYKENWKELVGE